jgi:hypothetical protein
MMWLVWKNKSDSSEIRVRESENGVFTNRISKGFLCFYSVRFVEQWIGE